jgi:hypothetical protein
MHILAGYYNNHIVFAGGQSSDEIDVSEESDESKDFPIKSWLIY